MEMAKADPAQLLPDLDQLRARVRADQRVTSAPLVVFGALILGYAVIGGIFAGYLSAGGRHSALLVYWPLATVVGLVVLWRLERRRASRDGVGAGQRSYRSATRGYLIALVLIVVLFVPILFVGVFTPMIWPAAVLAILGAWQRNRLLGTWASVLGVLGGTESLVLIAEPPLSDAWWWIQPLAYAAFGLALIVGGRVIGRRERTTA